MVDVEVDGKHYQELHVDGGAIAQLFIYPPNIEIKQFAEREREAFLIRNAREGSDPANVERRTLSVGGRAISTMLRASGANDLARIYFVTQRDQVDYNLAYIDTDFRVPHPKDDFNPDYMKALFQYGYERGRKGYPWRKSPPILDGLNIENAPELASNRAAAPE
jgi:hypothetical protein